MPFLLNIPPPYIILDLNIIERGANAVGMSIPPPATTEIENKAL
jgi:hypothetical protein